MQLRFIKKLYPKNVLIKSAYSFTDRAYLHLDEDGDYYIVTITFKNEPCFTGQEFENEMLIQTARYEVYKQTKELRKLTVARALASTIIDTTPETADDNPEEDFDIDKVLEDWFSEDE